MRACPNTNCVVFGRIVYTMATRCPLCKWDLKNTRRISEAAVVQKPERHIPLTR